MSVRSHLSSAPADLWHCCTCNTLTAFATKKMEVCRTNLVSKQERAYFDKRQELKKQRAPLHHQGMVVTSFGCTLLQTGEKKQNIQNEMACLIVVFLSSTFCPYDV